MLRLTPGRDFRLIWSAGIVSQLGDWSARLALALLVLDRGNGATTVGIVGLLFVAPWLGPGQFLTALSTRYGRRAVMIAADSFRGIAFVLIGALSPPTLPLLVIVGLAALADPVFEATKSAFVTEIVPKDDYSQAIQVTHAANQAASLGGYALGGLLVAIAGPELTLALNGVTFMISSSLVILVRAVGARESVGAEQPSFRAGLEFLRSDRLSGIAFLATVLAVTTAMSVESQVAVYGKVVADFGEEAIGLLSAATPAATLVAVALVQTTGSDVGLLRRGAVIAAIAATTGSVLLWSGLGGIFVFGGFSLIGVIFSFTTLTNVVVGRRIPDENRVAIFSMLQSGVFLGLSAGSLVGGILSEATSPEVAAGAALAVAALGLLATALRVGPDWEGGEYA